MEDVKRLYERLQALPWPALAGRIGDFSLYETLVAGCAHRVVHGQLLDLSTVPLPDEKTLEVIAEIRCNPSPSAEERIFLEYFELLEEIRSALGRT
jgi:hypothetical protein